MSANPDPERYRKWQIPSLYQREPCHYCDEDITHGQSINIEYENGLSHATCGGDG